MVCKSGALTILMELSSSIQTLESSFQNIAFSFLDSSSPFSPHFGETVKTTFWDIKVDDL